ncbi:nuclear transport factor 2 family protein [Clostridium sp.]|uniref:nuclear transport factor 2 family protein n=1 Tax=Clostridium sp. TaxID=1506 RepID=UPI001D6B73F7|nr:nuclear transport factor 2 family protein [Clostridium sp.]MBS5937511.1 nuclear transport factor 2 family protein [Clostridium sp.]
MNNKNLELEQRLNQLEDVEAIKQLKYTYALSLDEGYDGDKVAALFVNDGLWSISGVGGTAKGKDEIRKHTNNLGRDIKWGQHNIFAPIIDIAPDGLSAVGKFNLICLLTMVTPEFLNKEEAYVLSGKYKDKFVKIDGKWYFEELIGSIDQSSPWSEGWVKQPFKKEQW